jgi:hypothetical protein
MRFRAELTRITLVFCATRLPTICCCIFIICCYFFTIFSWIIPELGTMLTKITRIINRVEGPKKTIRGGEWEGANENSSMKLNICPKMNPTCLSSDSVTTHDHIAIEKLSVVEIGLGNRITSEAQPDASKTRAKL